MNAGSTTAAAGQRLVVGVQRERRQVGGGGGKYSAGPTSTSRSTSLAANATAWLEQHRLGDLPMQQGRHVGGVGRALAGHDGYDPSERLAGQNVVRRTSAAGASAEWKVGDTGRGKKEVDAARATDVAPQVMALGEVAYHALIERLAGAAQLPLGLFRRQAGPAARYGRSRNSRCSVAAMSASCVNETVASNGHSHGNPPRNHSLRRRLRESRRTIRGRLTVLPRQRIDSARLANQLRHPRGRAARRRAR